jgi:hypothetical protein
LQDTLTDTVKAVTTSQFDNTDPALLLKILKWGSMSEDLHIHKATLELLLQSLRGRVTPDLLQTKVKRAIPIETAAARLSTVLPQEEVTFLTAA